MDNPGFFGKLPGNGDFVSRRLSREFLDVWDNWLQLSIAESKANLGDRWLDAYLTSPIWRFALMPGICGASAYIGLVMPSVDRVGRYFPLTIAAELPTGTSALGSAIAAAAWFDHCEEVLLSTLGDNPPDLQQFDNHVEQSTGELFPAGTLSLPRIDNADPVHRQWRLGSPAGASTGLSLSSLAGGIILEELGPISIWWAASGQAGGSQYRASRGLPSPAVYVDMLGNAEGAIPEDWQTEVPVESVAEPVVMPPTDRVEDITLPPEVSTSESIETLSLEALINTPVDLSFNSAAKTISGKVRRENEDAVLDRPEKSLWLVADGMGGHSAGKAASAAIVSAIDDIDLPDTIDSRIAAISRALQSVNGQLRSIARRRPGGAATGSTVAVFTASGGTGAIVWAGDTRVYRKRGQQLEQLTLDHSEHQERIERGDISSILGSESNVVTRAVGGDDVLQVSIAKQSIHPGDRYLICSDGVHRELPAFQLAALMENGVCMNVCDGILDAVMDGRALDNASAVCIEAASA